MGSALLLLIFCYTLCFTEAQFPYYDHFESIPPLPHQPQAPAAGPHHAVAPSHHHHHIHLAPTSSHHGAPIHPSAGAPSSHHHHHIHLAPKSSHHGAPIHPPVGAPSPHHQGMAPGPSPAEGSRRSYVAVQGVVYRKACKYVGFDTLLNATPVFRATVKLQCNSTRYTQQVSKETDKNGYFYLTAPKTVTSYGAHKCRVYLVSAPPQANITLPSDLHGGVKGASLRPEKAFTVTQLPYILYNVGPLAFQPKC